MGPRFGQFIQERKYLANVSKQRSITLPTGRLPRTGSAGKAALLRPSARQNISFSSLLLLLRFFGHVVVQDCQSFCFLGLLFG
jgi:hypothetical protein